LQVTDTTTNTVSNPTEGTTNTFNNELDTALARGKSLGITSSSTVQQFRPNDYITRGEFAKMITTYIASNNQLRTTERNADCLFHDFQEAREFALYMYDACANGLMYGNQNRFYPQNSLSRAEAIAAIVRHIAGNMNQVATPRYANYVSYAKNQGLIDNDTQSAMEQKMVRFEALLLLWRAENPN
jgi:hypothetical protein